MLDLRDDIWRSIVTDKLALEPVQQDQISGVMLNMKSTSLALAIALALGSTGVMADSGKSSDGNGAGSACKKLATALGTTTNGLHATLKAALETAVAAESTGLDLEMWATLVNRDGIVCAVAFSGDSRFKQWPGSRVISAQKANTANAFSLDGLALSTANLYSAVQPGGSLFGLQESNPVDTEAAYKGPAKHFGKKQDPMVGEAIGGVNVFGGGVALYATNHTVVGGLGLSGDTSCADHNIAWRVRNELGLDNLAGVGGVGPNRSVKNGD
jgi:uncharacterized protein GlcG (DUF336 family)